MTTTVADSLKEFRSTLKEVKGLALSVGAGSVIAPLLASLSAYQPPWPHGISALAALTEFVTFILCFQLGKNSSVRTSGIMVVVCACLQAVVAITYMFLASRFMLPLGTSSETIVLGCGLTEEAKILLDPNSLPVAEQCPGDFHNLLASAQYEATVIWIPSSVQNLKMLLASVWLTNFACFAAMLIMFVLSQQKGSAQRRTRPAVNAGPSERKNVTRR